MLSLVSGLSPLWVTRPMWRIHRGIGMRRPVRARIGGPEVEEAHGDDLRAAWAEEFDQLIDEIQPFEGAHELLAEVKKRGFRLVLASSGKTQHVEAFLSLIDGKSLADAWTTSDDVQKSKPAPDIVAAALAKVEGASGVMVGDSIFDAQAAGKLKIPTIGVRTGGFSVGELQEADVLQVFDSLVAFHHALDGTPLAHASRSRFVAAAPVIANRVGCVSCRRGGPLSGRSGARPSWAVCITPETACIRIGNDGGPAVCSAQARPPPSER